MTTTEPATRAELDRRQGEIQGKLRRLMGEMESIAYDEDGEARTLSSGQQERFANLEKAMEKATAELEEVREQLRADLVGGVKSGRFASHSGDGARDFQHQRKVTPFDGSDPRDLPPGEAVERARALVGNDRQEHVSDASREHLDRLLRSTDHNIDRAVLARRALLTEGDAYRRAWQQVITSPHPVLEADEARALRAYREFQAAELREANITTPADGGYGVPVTIDPTVILTDQGALSPIREIARTVNITTKDWRGVSAAGVTWTFQTESAVSNDISPTLAQPIIHAHKADGTIPFTIEVGMDYPGFAMEMTRVLGEGYDELLADKLVTGSGTGEPFGIFVACEQATSQVVVDTDGALNVEDVLKLWKAVPNRFRRNAAWLMNIDVNNEVALFGDDKLYRQTVDLRDGAIDRIKGRPVYESPYAPEFTGTTGQASIMVIGDWSRYVIAQRAGMNVELVPHLFDTASTGLPIGQRALYAWTRVGADLVVDNAFRMLVNT